MKKRIWKLISVTTLFVLIALAIFYLSRYKSDLYLLRNISVYNLIVLSILVNLVGFVNAFRVKIFASFFKIPLTFTECFGLQEITTMSNYLAPFRGGAGVRAFYLKNKYQFQYNLFLSTMGANFIIAFFTYSLIGCLLLLWIYLIYTSFNYTLSAILAISLLSSLSVILFSDKIPRLNIKIFKRAIDFMYKVKDGWEYIRKDPKKMIKIALVEVFYILFSTLSLYYTFVVLSTHVSFAYSMIIIVIGSLSFLIAITPGGLGIKEGVIVWVSTIMGIGLEVSLYAAIIVRLITAIWTFILGPIFSYILIRPMQK